MANLIYSSPSYAMGAAQNGDTPNEKRQAEVALKSMRSGLKEWLKFRQRMDKYTVGMVEAPKLFRHPGFKPLPPDVVSATLRNDRYREEQDLAETLYHLLVECGADPSSLPRPDVAMDPDAAVKLATIAIKGKTPSEAASPTAQGIVWFVLLIPVAGVVIVLSQLIKSKADVIKEKERLRCIEAGACTDTGFWLKLASVSVLGWLAWDKMGLREQYKKSFKK
jgi:hypothetical protein